MGAFRESNSGPLAPKARIIPLDQMPVKGAFRESNSGPLAPKARIIPLDQMPGYWCFSPKLYLRSIALFLKEQLLVRSSSSSTIQWKCYII
ncbi:hypothetical protein YC2023_096345 [Brassica napus]